MLSSFALAAALIAADPAPKPFEFKDGDRVVWLGNTLVEREQRYGYWETALIATNPNKNITFRNLGWSGDTVHGEARGRFDFNNPNECFKQLTSLAIELKPTVVFVSYGTNEAFEGKEGLPKFEKGLEKLLDALKPTNARIVLFTPMAFEEAFPGAAARNEDLSRYADAVRKVGEHRGLPVADMFLGSLVSYEIAKKQKPPFRLTDNGMHLTKNGYLHTAESFVLRLKLAGAKSGTVLPEAPALDWPKLKPLLTTVVAKNEQFFNKWRPQNETYLTGFRKHEQGKNAKETAEFDPFIEKAEAEIAKLRKGLK